MGEASVNGYVKGNLVVNYLAQTACVEFDSPVQVAVKLGVEEHSYVVKTIPLPFNKTRKLYSSLKDGDGEHSKYLPLKRVKSDTAVQMARNYVGRLVSSGDMLSLSSLEVKIT